MMIFAYYELIAVSYLFDKLIYLLVYLMLTCCFIVGVK